MTKQKFQIQIPEPCPQDLNAMPVQGNGRFCASCHKCVIDFTLKTDREILTVFQENNGQVCGTFRPDQLNRLLLPAGNQPTSRWKTLAFAVMAFLSGNPESEANPKLNRRSLFTKTALFPKNEVVGKPVTFSGHIRNKITGQPIQNVSITLVGTPDTLGWTNKKGNFRFTLPAASFGPEPVRILFYHDDYVGAQISFTRDSVTENLALIFEPVIREIDPVYVNTPIQGIIPPPEYTSGPALINTPYISPQMLHFQPGNTKPVKLKPKKKMKK